MGGERSLHDSGFRSLLEANRLGEAAAFLQARLQPGANELRNEIAAWQAELSELDAQRRRAAMSVGKYNTARKRLVYGLLDIARVVEFDAASAPAPAATSRAPMKPEGGSPEKIFISYNHADADAAQAIKRALVERGLNVRIDSADLQPGDDIRTFIKQSIRGTTCTLCLVSQSSLLSGWVGLESMLALMARELWTDRLFAAGYLDTDFLDIGFRLDATRQIDERVAEIDRHMVEYLRRQLDTIDLNAERTRLLDLRSQLGAILAALRGSLCLDMRPAAREASVARFCDSLAQRAA